jgi:N-sulfoglucosamine sulfohydrolase
MKPSTWILLLFIAVSFYCCSHENSQPPNILWITCEDISPALGCYGDEYASTPNLDRLADEGLLYTRAYATAPICAPSRSALITGIFATTLGTQHLRSEIPLPEDFKILPEYLREAGYYCSNNAKTDYNFDPAGRWDENSNTAHWRNRKEGQLFFSVFNYGITHEGHANSLDPEDTRTLETKHDPGNANLPPYFPDTPEFRKIWAHQYDLVSVLDQDYFASLISQLKEDGLYENTIIFFFSDHGFGLPRYKRWLYNTGLHVPLIVRIPEKYRHLATSGPGSKEDRLVSFEDFAPTVLALAGLPVPEHMYGKPFLGENPAGPEEYVFGARSRADDAYDVSRCILNDRYIYIRNFMPHQPYIQEAIIFNEEKASFAELRRLKEEDALNTNGEKFWKPKSWEELYDLKNDPYELVNLTDDPAYLETVTTMRQALYKKMIETHDVGLLPESEMMLRSTGSSPYEMASFAGEYHIGEILEAASICGNEQVTFNEILPLLGDEDSGVRYWAVIALQSKKEEAQFAVEELKKCLYDPSPCVAIATAELLCHQDYCDEALPVIGKYLRDEANPTVVLQAAISTRKIGNKALPLIPVIGEVYPAYRGEIWNRYKSWSYPMFIGFALDQTYLNCGLELP